MTDEAALMSTSLLT